jgi:hypothetical protein
MAKRRCGGCKTPPRGPKVVLQMSGIVLFDHLDAGAAVLGNLIDVSAFKKVEAGIAKGAHCAGWCI